MFILHSDSMNTFYPLPEIDRIQKGETKKEAETYLDLFTTKNIKLKERVLIPVKQYPKVSFLWLLFPLLLLLFSSWLNFLPSALFQLHKVMSLKWLLSTLIFKLQIIITAHTGILENITKRAEMIRIIFFTSSAVFLNVSIQSEALRL